MQICTFCIMDQTDPDITFDSKGQCHHCRSYLEAVPLLPFRQPDAQERLDVLIADIKKKGNGRKYDCIIGLSGGVDSTYLAYVAKKVLGLRPLAIHMDNGWNSELSVKNVENIVKKLDIDLYTKILDWEEFRSLQLALLKASTPDSEIPTDHAICATLYEMANKYSIHYVLSGANFITERIMPPEWSQGHSDYRYINGVNKIWGTQKLKTFPHYTQFSTFYYRNIKGITILPLFDYYQFDPHTARHVIESELEWQEYGGKHYESIYTKFFQGHILPHKFGYDKRKAHLSNLICAGLMSRQEALDIVKTPPLSDNEIPYLRSYVAKKMEIEESKLEEILVQPKKRYADYPNYYNSLWYRKSRKYLKPPYRLAKKVLQGAKEVLVR